MSRSWFLAVLAVATACERGPQPVPGVDTGLLLARSSDAKDSLIRVKDSLLAQRSRQISEQSQLLGDAATSARLASQIDRELSSVRGLRVRGPDSSTIESEAATATRQLEQVDRKVKALIARLNASETHVRRMRADSVTRVAYDSTQLMRIGEYERSIAELRGTVERQRLEIVALTQRVDSMAQANTVLVARVDTVTGRNTALLAREDSVFVIMGTERELLTRGVVRKEGGTRFLFGRGRTLVPARTLSATAFQVMSKARDVAITLPNQQKNYRVVSRQSLDYTTAPATKNATVRGTFQITDPVSFWAPSRFLILVER